MAVPAVPIIPWREPISFVQGDTLQFNRHLGNYPGSQGWTLLYELRGGAQPLSFVSAPASAGSDDFAILVAAAVTETWIPGDYILVGFAVNAGLGQRFQFFENALPITADAATLPGDAIVTTHYQRMVTALQTVMETKSFHDLKVTKIEMTMIERLTFDEMSHAYARYYRLRQNEIDGDRARAGLPSRNKIKPRFSITPPGAVTNVGPDSSDLWYGGNEFLNGGGQ
jgi:hypothetical protein